MLKMKKKTKKETKPPIKADSAKITKGHILDYDPVETGILNKYYENHEYLDEDAFKAVYEKLIKKVNHVPISGNYSGSVTASTGTPWNNTKGITYKYVGSPYVVLDEASSVMKEYHLPSENPHEKPQEITDSPMGFGERLAFLGDIGQGVYFHIAPKPGSDGVLHFKVVNKEGTYTYFDLSIERVKFAKFCKRALEEYGYPEVGFEDD